MSFLSQPISLFSIKPKRQFADITGFVTISDSTTDTLEITQQPVQQGATITDHAFKKPTGFSMQMLLSDNMDFGFDTLSEVYQSLLDLQISRVPFDIITPKRVYKNMLLQNLGQTTDKKTESVLAINAAFQEVIIVKVSTTTVPRAAQKTPAVTGATENAGKKSALLTAKQGVGALFHTP